MNLEFIVQQTLNFVVILEGLAALASIIYLRNNKNIFVNKLPILLILIFIIELLSINNVLPDYSKPTIYNIVSLVTFNYFSWLFRNSYVNQKHVRVSLFAAFTINMAYIVEFVFWEAQNISLVYAYSLGGIIMIVLTSLYFVQKLENEEELLIKQDILFWISAGNLLFYVGYLPIKLTRMFFASVSNHLSYLHVLHLSLIILLNVCYIIGCRWNRMNS